MRIRICALILLVCLLPGIGTTAASYADLKNIGQPAYEVYDEGLGLLLSRMCVDVTGYRKPYQDAAGFCHQTMEASGITQIYDLKGRYVYQNGEPIERTLSDWSSFHVNVIVSALRVALNAVGDNGVTALLLYAADLVTPQALVELYKKSVLDASRQFEENPYASVGLTYNAAGEPVVVTIFRGTHDAAGWISDGITMEWGGVHVGFSSQYEIFSTVAQEMVVFDLKDGKASLGDLIDRAAAGEKIHFVAAGHSLGGALTQIYIEELAKAGVPFSQMLAYTFAAPLAYSAEYWDGLSRAPGDYPVFNVINMEDVVPRVGITKTYLSDTAVDFLVYLLDRDFGITVGKSVSGIAMGRNHPFSARADVFGLPYRSIFSNHNKFLYESYMRKTYNETHPENPIPGRAIPTAN